MKTLKRDHNQNILIFTAKENADESHSFDGNATNGWAADFWKHHNEVGHPSNLMMRAFTKSFKASKYNLLYLSRLLLHSLTFIFQTETIPFRLNLLK